MRHGLTTPNYGQLWPTKGQLWTSAVEANSVTGNTWGKDWRLSKLSSAVAKLYPMLESLGLLPSNLLWLWAGLLETVKVSK